MNYRNIPKTDLNVSSLALGTWVFSGDSWGEAQEGQCVDAVSAALDQGLNFIDTAPIYGYGRAEEIVGKAIKGRRDQCVIASKCGLIGRGKNITMNLTPESIFREIDETLKRLKIECVDLYQCHWPDPQTPIEKTMEAMCDLKRKGKIKYIGVSNFDIDLFKKAATITDVVTTQNQYSLVERSIEKEILPFANERGIGVMTYGSLGGGILSGKYRSQPQFAKADARTFFYRYYSGERFTRINQLLADLDQFKKPLNQIAINWIRQQPGITSVIVGCRNPQQVKANVAALSWEFDPEQLREFDTILKERDFMA